jgi:hypothetical protein
MRNNWNQPAIIARAAACSACLLVTACGDGSSVAPPPPPRHPAFVMSYDEFASRVEPVLAVNACDNASCHGGSGAGSFRLSPATEKDVHFDFAQSCLQVVPADPSRSPLAMKPLAEQCGGDAHAGGAFFFSLDDPGYVAIITWIGNGEYR